MFLGVTGSLEDMNETDASQQAWRDRVAAAVASERVKLGLSKEAAAKEAGISSITWKRVEDGLPVRDTKMRAIELALNWSPGDADMIGDGLLVPGAGAPRTVPGLDETLEKLEEDVYDDYKYDTDHAGESSGTIRMRIEKTVAATVEAAGPEVADDKFIQAVTSQVVRHERGWISSRVEQLPLGDCLAVADYIIQFEIESDEERTTEEGEQDDMDQAAPARASSEADEGEKTRRGVGRRRTSVRAIHDDQIELPPVEYLAAESGGPKGIPDIPSEAEESQDPDNHRK